MSPIAIQLLKIYHQSSLYIDLSALFDLFAIFFAVFKMIGREHQARLELPSFGFSKVRNPYAITDHPKMMLCYKAMCPSPLACTVCTGPLYIVLPKQILFKNLDIIYLLGGW